MSDLVIRLKVAIDAEEQLASTVADHYGTRPWPRGTVVGIFETHGKGDPAGEFIARMTPSVALRKVAGARLILEEHGPIFRDICWLDDGGDEHYAEREVCVICVPKHSWFNSEAEVLTYPCDTLKAVALMFNVEEATDGRNDLAGEC